MRDDCQPTSQVTKQQHKPLTVRMLREMLAMVPASADDYRIYDEQDNRIVVAEDYNYLEPQICNNTKTIHLHIL